MRENINSYLKKATRVEYCGADGNSKITEKKTLSAIMEEIGGFPRLANGKWEFPPRLLSKDMGGNRVIFHYRSALFEFSIVINT